MYNYILLFFIFFSLTLAANSDSSTSVIDLTKIYIGALKELGDIKTNPNLSISTIINLCNPHIKFTTFGRTISSLKHFKSYLRTKQYEDKPSTLTLLSTITIHKKTPTITHLKYKVKTRNSRYTTHTTLTWHDNKIINIKENVQYPGFL